MADEQSLRSWLAGMHRWGAAGDLSASEPVKSAVRVAMVLLYATVFGLPFAITIGNPFVWGLWIAIAAVLIGIVTALGVARVRADRSAD